MESDDMTGIEWQKTDEYLPIYGSIRDFCRSNWIQMDKLYEEQGLIAFIEQQALEGLNDFLEHDLHREHGGVLVGKPFFDQDQNHYFTVIRTAIPAHETEGSAVHLQFTPDTWSYISGIIEENFPDLVVVGWYHSHPGLGVFMSGTDRATQAAFFDHAWNIAIVVDPIAHTNGWFSGKDCAPMGHSHVIPYELPIKAKPVDISLEAPTKPMDELYRKSYLRRLGWLLPFVAVLIIAGVAGIWLLNKKPKEYE
jgi:proteasome lid subunit RPN8/RPN11